MAITFNGFNLNDGVNYIVQEISDGRGIAERNIQYGEISSREGVKLLSEEYRRRVINISGIVFADTADNFQVAIDNLKSNLGGSSAQLIVDDTGRYYTATVSSIDISDAGAEITSTNFNISFFCEMPFALAGLHTTNYTVPSGSTSVVGAITISGTAPARPVMTYYIPDGDGVGRTTTSGITIEHIETGNYVTWSGTYSSRPVLYSGTIAFSYDNNSVIVRGTEEDYNGLFDTWSIGANNFSVTYSGLAVGGSLVLSYNPRYY